MDMKWLIASDIHGSALYCGELIKAFGREGADRLLLLGDLLYHGPRNDLPKGYAPKEVIAQLSGLKDKIFCVRGNCEAQVDQMVLPFPVMAEYCLIETADRLVFATHGHVYNTDNPPALFEGDVLLHGHTHIPAKTKVPAGWWYLNPGSVSIPKEGSPRGYLTLEKGLFLWNTLEGREYDRLAL
jgi:putative phosphoesterase